jgi:hypothetical protein
MLANLRQSAALLTSVALLAGAAACESNGTTRIASVGVPGPQGAPGPQGEAGPRCSRSSRSSPDGRWRREASPSSALHAFADSAAVHRLERPGVAERDTSLSSFGLGLRAAWSRQALLELELARPIERPEEHYASDWRLTIGWRLSLRP